MLFLEEQLSQYNRMLEEELISAVIFGRRMRRTIFGIISGLSAWSCTALLRNRLFGRRRFCRMDTGGYRKLPAQGVPVCGRAVSE